MTRGEILIQICSEASGQPKERFEEAIEMFKIVFPTGHRLDEEVSDKASQEILNELREEKEEILAWIIKGAKEAHKSFGHA